MKQFTRSLALRAVVGCSSALLALMTAACGGDTAPWDAADSTPPQAIVLRQQFPAQAVEILEQEHTFLESPEGFTLIRENPGGWATLNVDLPKDAAGKIRMRGFGGYELQVRELNAQGASSLTDHAVSYRRAGGTSFWTATSSGAEEWLLLDAGAASGEEPVASWEVDGVTPTQREGVVDLVDDTGVVRASVAAPKAFAEDGSEIGAGVFAVGNTIELEVDASDGVVLVDPAWTVVPSMSAARGRHTATALGSGKVLVVGGLDPNNNSLSSAELFDPTLNTWSAAASMSVGRSDTTATLIGNGKVLLAGGGIPGGKTATAELYDPATNSWSLTGSMLVARYRHSATLLGSGKVLVVGGYASNVLASAELFDAASGTWSLAGSMATARDEHSATLLTNGKVLVAGGVDINGVTLASVEFYDPSSNTWSSGPTMSTPRRQHTATTLSDGSVLVAGGFGASSTLATAEVYSPVTNSWSVKPSMAQTRRYHTAMMIAGQVIVAGGWSPSLSSSESYSLVNNTWSSAGSMSFVRDNHTATVLGNGKGLVVGGSNGTYGSYLSSAELFSLLTTGTACTSSGECASGSCVDGVCCNTSCTGSCQACTAAKKGSGSDGTCGNIGSGLDPDNECTAQSASTCGLNGYCSGSGTCQLFPNATVCVSASCSGSILTKADLCNGSGTCVDYGTQDCSPYACSGSACLASCTNDTQCTSTSYCSGTTCTTKKANGTACTGSNQCTSGSCVDGVCCNTSCTGTCSACTAANKGSGSDGTCGNIGANSDPDNECTAQNVSTCGMDGMCNGLGACGNYANGTVCAAASCSGSVLTKADTCNGSAVCVDAGSQDCAPYACSVGGCLSSCVSDAECSTGNYCQAGSCLAQKAAGGACSAANECSGGSCVDGVCCDSSCTAGCFACSASKKGAGVDGVCEPILTGNDPDSECGDQGAASCGTNGACDGAGSCQVYAANTVCAAPSCSGTVLTSADLCDGAGTCTDLGTTDCSPYACTAGACLDVCMADSDCAPTAYCTGSVCLPKLTDGGSCAASNECESTFCVDGVCCNSACDGSCVACSAAKTGGLDGTCDNVPVNNDPDNECDDQGAASCGTVGSCNGQGACGYYASDTTCAPAICTDSTTLQNAASCDGSGTCVDQGVTDCAPFACTAGTCLVACANDADCASSAHCDAGTCVPSESSSTSGSGGSGGSAGSSTSGTGTGGSGGMGGDDSREDQDNGPDPDPNGYYGCSAAPNSSPSLPAAWLAWIGLAMIALRRQRRLW